MTKYIVTYHGDVWNTYKSLDDLLADEYFFKNLYSMASTSIVRYDVLSEKDKRLIDARSWEVREWGFYPKPDNSSAQTINGEVNDE